MAAHHVVKVADLLSQRAGLVKALTMAMARVKLVELVRVAHNTRQFYGDNRWGHGRLTLPASVAGYAELAYANLKSARTDLSYCDRGIEWFGGELCEAMARRMVQDAMLLLSR